MRKECSGCSFATVLSQSLTVPEQANSGILACGILYYKIHTFFLSVQANVLYEADVSGKKAFLRNKEKQARGIKGQLKRVLSARNWVIDFFSHICKIILNVFSPTTDKTYSNHCLKKMNGRLPKKAVIWKIDSFFRF